MLPEQILFDGQIRNKPHHAWVASSRGDESLARHSDWKITMNSEPYLQGFWYILESFCLELAHRKPRKRWKLYCDWQRPCITNLEPKVMRLLRNYTMTYAVGRALWLVCLCPFKDGVLLSSSRPCWCKVHHSCWIDFLLLLLWMRVYTSMSRSLWMKPCQIPWEVLPRETILTSRGQRVPLRSSWLDPNTCWALARIGVLTIATFVCFVGNRVYQWHSTDSIVCI